ncbi:HTH_Tnp_Tc3_2 domain-containing protein [Trichonephila clavipes]|nr:HTH_Tnp_Tc3_2 domain-containing protein [Trichonephila clavipes]
MALMERAATSRALSQELGSFARQQVSARTVRRRLLQHGLSARRPCLRLPLTLHHRQERLQLYDQQRTWAHEWGDVIFSDESVHVTFLFHGKIVEVETGSDAIYRPYREFYRAKSYCHLYGAQGLGQRQAYF